MRSTKSESITHHNPSTMTTTSFSRSNKKLASIFACALVIADSVLIFLIISYVPYTKIDWDAYMSQVTGFLEGERDYSNLKGDTGPLVYPAGFLYVYSAIQYVTGGQVQPAQILFAILYIVNLIIVFFIYVKTDLLPWWALSLLCLSKRVHSIFVLRLFNDCIATTLLHAALATIIYQRWCLGLIIFSLAVSIKMNVLLYAPALFLLMLKAIDISGTIVALGGAAVVQILIGLPFLVSYPVAYISRAFNLGRVFIHFWSIWSYDHNQICTLSPSTRQNLTQQCALHSCVALEIKQLALILAPNLATSCKRSVNFKFVPEPIFVSKAFAISLLLIHLGLLAVFAHKKWCKHEGGLLKALHSVYISTTSSFPVQQLYAFGRTSKPLKTEHIVTTMFVGNFIGIVCARSLHYQFYSWYFYSLPYLLWKTPFPTLLRLALFVGVECCWNIYPSNSYSSAILLCIHLVILWGLWIASPEHPYVENASSSEKKRK